MWMGLEHKVTGAVHIVAVSVIISYMLLGLVPKSYAIVASVFFIVKGVVFSVMKRNPLSFLDALSGLYILLPLTGLFSNLVLNIVFIGFLAQKGIMYLFR